MSITLHTEPVYNLTCNQCEWAAEVEGDGHLWRFDSEALARDWADANGWTADAHTTLCRACTNEAKEQQEQAEEIADVIRYATEEATR